MKMNKNVFALALCFAAFTAQAENSTESTETTQTFQMVNGEMLQVISLDHVKTLLTAEQVAEFIAAFNATEEGVDGIGLVHDGATYFVKASEFTSKKDTTTMNDTPSIVEKSDDSVTANDAMVATEAPVDTEEVMAPALSETESNNDESAPQE